MNNEKGSTKPVLFIDSGIGGLPYLEWVMHNLPALDSVYVADNRFFPYGTREIGAIRDNLRILMTGLIRRFDPQLVAVVCNTASVTSLEYLRGLFAVPFVGVVPAVKPAAEKTRSGEIALLATERTVDDVYTQNLIDNYANHCRVIKIGTPVLAEFVERHYKTADPRQIDEVLSPIVSRIRGTKADFLVLGCTHFVFVQQELQRMLTETVAVIDSREGVGRQVQRLSAAGNGRQKGTHIMYTTAEAPEYRKFADQFNITFGGTLPDGV